jgi:pimeloyl-[acyl-carrier protein] methyl ester esterase
VTELFILPGMDGTGELSRDFCAALAQRDISARALRYPGDQALGYEPLEATAREHLPSTPFVLLGESFSGPIAIRLAADAALTQLRGVVLSTTFARAPHALFKPISPLIDLAPTQLPMPILSWFLFGRWSTSALRTQLANALKTVDAIALRERLKAVLHNDARSSLSAITGPRLQLIARQDRLIPISEKLIGPADDMLYFDGPHLLLQTEINKTADAVAAFVRRCLSPASNGKR